MRVSKNKRFVYGAEGSARRRKVSRTRVIIWCVEAVILVFVLVYFVLIPVIRSGKPEVPRGMELPDRYAGKIQDMDTNAEGLKGLKKVDDASLPAMKYLAAGSELALDSQLDVAREYDLPIEVVNSIGIQFRLIPPGTFVMGSYEGERRLWKQPNAMEQAHVMEVERPFYMSKFEVTQGQWNTLMPSNPSGFRGRNLPVEEISWYDCQRFLEKLHKKEGVGWGTYRLPVEAEWEYACRAGTATTFVCGDSDDNLKYYANYVVTEQGGTVPEGNRLPNAWGLFHMHGNVMEWCHNVFYSYESAIKITEQWRGARTIRGGHWSAPAADCRSANRARLGGTSHGNVLGFRIVRDIPASRLRKSKQDDEQ